MPRCPPRGAAPAGPRQPPPVQWAPRPPESRASAAASAAPPPLLGSLGEPAAPPVRAGGRGPGERSAGCPGAPGGRGRAARRSSQPRGSCCGTAWHRAAWPCSRPACFASINGERTRVGSAWNSSSAWLLPAWSRNVVK